MVALAVLSRSVRRAVNLWFFGLAAASACWTFGIAGYLSVHTTNAAIHWAQFYYIAPLAIVAASVPFARVFPSGGNFRTLRVYLTLVGFFIFAGLLLFDPNFMFGGIVYHSWGKEVILHTWQYAAYGVYLLVAFVLTLIPMYQKTRTEKGIFRSQAAVFYDGYIISCVLGVFFNLFLPGLGNYRLIWFGPLAPAAYVSLPAYGMVRHRLFDVRLVAARAVGYLLSILALGTLYGVIAFMVIAQIPSGDASKVPGQAMSAALAVGLAVLFQPVKRFFDRITNGLFYRDAYDSQLFVDRFNHALVSTIDLDDMLKNTTQVIQTTLKVDYCAVVIEPVGKVGRRIVGSGQYQHLAKDGLHLPRTLLAESAERVLITDHVEQESRKSQMELQSKNIALTGRIASGNKREATLGYLILGPKKSGYPLSSQDVKAIELTLNEYVIAIQNTLRFEEIERFNATLQERIEDATKRLRQSNAKLRTLDETKDDFISMASHQLRTPLTSVKGYVSMVLDGDAGKITPLQRKLLTQSFVSAQRMVYLISDLLNLSRLKTGKFIIEATPCNLADIVKGEIEQLVETAKARDLTLVYNKPEHFPTYMLDETKLRQVIMNFVDNAIYYTPGGGRIEVNVIDKPEAIELTVVDNGIGVPKSEQHHLFSKFFRAHNAKRARPDGTGLGLFMAKKVVIAQGGAIIFRSAEGKGSTFGFTFAKHKLQSPPKVG